MLKKLKKAKIWKNKRGGIPAINELVLTLLNTTPKPILLLIFVLLITTISSFVIPVFLNLFGYACVEEQTALELYQVPLSNMLRKTVLDIQRGFEGILGVEQFQLPDDPFPNGDKTRLRIPAECFTTSDVNGTVLWGYTASCVDCPTNANFFQGFFTPKDQLICTGDGYAESGGILNIRYCAQCTPPEPYYYNHTNCVNEFGGDCYYTITDPALASTISSDYYNEVNLQKILELNGVKRTQDSAELINVQCSAVGKPNLYVFSIELFNRTMWIYLLIGSALISFAMMWYGQVL